MTDTYDLRDTSEGVADWLRTRQQTMRVTETTTTPAGHVLDWIPADSQGVGEPAAPPPPGPVLPRYGEAGRLTAAPELDLSEPGPDGHVPILRPDPATISSRLVTGRGPKQGGLRVNINRANLQATDPNPAGYFHATSAQTVTCYGCEGWLNVWDPQVDIPSSPGDDHSISQTWLQNYQTPHVQSIEAGLTVDKSLNGDAANHLFSYFTTNGYASDGDNVGGYNRLHKGWVQYDASIYPGIRINGSSGLGNPQQLEIGIKFQLFNGDWWLGFSSNESGPWTWLGYYPASLFGTSGMTNLAQWVSFGGEVYSALANPCSTTDQMGSGRHAAAGYSQAAFQRSLRYQSTTGGGLANMTGIPEVDAAASGCPTNQYTIQCFMNSGSSFESYQYYGGPAA
jgi:hypothetical protein